ncbi:MAG: M64 family metallopeptidase [Armatimonadota bacterium]
MRKMILVVFLLVTVLSLNSVYAADVNFDDYFVDKTMRIDLYHTGDSTTDIYSLDNVYTEGQWAGSVNNLVDYMNNGAYFVKVYDLDTNKMIFSRGFDSIFREYITTDDAINGAKKTFSESVIMPYPKNKIKLAIERRDKKNEFDEVFSCVIDPSSTTIIKEERQEDVEVIDFQISGDNHKKVDLLFLAEGYTKDQRQKFIDDVNRLLKVFWAQAPYDKYKDSFNVRGVFLPSKDPGCDESSHGAFKRTSFNSGYDFFGSERYLMTEDNKAMRNVAGTAPYDTLYMLVNQDRYGGGAIYNLYASTIVDNYWTDYVFLHEFGHSFAGLADEYYTSAVEYNDFYPKGYEPVEPNITALLDKDNVKWGNLCSSGIAVPSFWEKAEFDKMDLAYQKKRQELNKKIAKMKREGAEAAEVEKYEQLSEKLSREHAVKVDDYLSGCANYGKTGVFEGAGYCSKEMYRPELDCIMFSKGAKPFCKVCRQAVIERIKFYSE